MGGISIIEVYVCLCVCVCVSACMHVCVGVGGWVISLSRTVPRSPRFFNAIRQGG